MASASSVFNIFNWATTRIKCWASFLSANLQDFAQATLANSLSKITVSKMFLLKTLPNLIGIIAGDVQYSDFSDKALFGIAQQYCADNSISEIILEIDKLLPLLPEHWQEFSDETNVSFESYSDAKNWLLIFKAILERVRDSSA